MRHFAAEAVTAWRIGWKMIFFPASRGSWYANF
jgi:hypothetical protein